MSWLLGIMLQWTLEFLALQDNDFISFEYRPRSRVARLYGNSIFNFLKNFQIHTIFHYDCTNWRAYQLCPRVLFSLHLCHSVQFSSVSHSVVFDSLRPHEPQHTRPPYFLITVILKVWGDISLWFWIVVLQWLVMLSIFSYIYWNRYIFSGKISIQILWSFLIGLFTFIATELYQFPIYSGH